VDASTQQMTNILITGIHRSGTTLVCRLLSSLEDVVALQEPMNVLDFADKDTNEIQALVEEFIDNSRYKLLQFHKAHTRHIKGTNSDNYFPDETSKTGLRETRAENGFVYFDKHLSNDFLLIIKHNAAFTALLNRLYPKFRCYAIIRNPLAILASWQTVDMSVNKGRLPVAEAIDPCFSKTLLTINHTIDRQIFILNWFFNEYVTLLPSVNIIRYEDIISTKGKCLSVICQQAINLNESLYSKNKNPLYNNQNLPKLVDKLLNSNGSWLHYYSKEDIEKLAYELLNINWLPASNAYGQYCVPVASAHRPVSQCILRSEIHEPETIEFIRENCKDGDVVHAGTFFGDFLPAISSALAPDAKIWAFEPNYENYYCAKNTIRLNNLQNIEIQNKGLGEAKAKAQLQIRSRQGKNLGGGSKITMSKDQKLTVEVGLVSIDQVISSNRKISIIQLDVEGYEKQALTGALNKIIRNKPIIIIEDNNGIIESEWFKINIISLGYKLSGKVHNNHIIRYVSV
jgi:FkbM family methyltransferase